MTDATDTAMSGEARLKSRRKRLIRFCAVAFIISAVAGLATGVVSDLYDDGVLPGWSIFVCWGIALAGFVCFTWEYLRRVDELDLLDNLWACLVGFYFYIVAMPSWYLFEDLGLAPAVNHLVIYAATFGASVVAYIFRKLGLR